MLSRTPATPLTPPARFRSELIDAGHAARIEVVQRQLRLRALIVAGAIALAEPDDRCRIGELGMIGHRERLAPGRFPLLPPRPEHGHVVRVPLARAAMAAGADAVMVDVHPRPETALCDGAQALTGSSLDELAEAAVTIPALLGRTSAVHLMS